MVQTVLHKTHRELLFAGDAVMYIFVGSNNPVKINAVVTAASEAWPDAKVSGYDVPSGVAEQPIGDEMTRQGAQNRARAAFHDGIAQHTNLDETSEVLGIGLEGGVVEYDSELWSTVWIAVTDRTGEVYESNGARFKIPELVARKIRAGEEMGPVVARIAALIQSPWEICFARIAGVADVRKKQGFIGVLTDGFVDRTEEYSNIAKLALGVWYGRMWQNSLSPDTEY